MSEYKSESLKELLAILETNKPLECRHYTSHECYECGYIRVRKIVLDLE